MQRIYQRSPDRGALYISSCQAAEKKGKCFQITCNRKKGILNRKWGIAPFATPWLRHCLEKQSSNYPNLRRQDAAVLHVISKILKDLVNIVVNPPAAKKVKPNKHCGLEVRQRYKAAFKRNLICDMRAKYTLNRSVLDIELIDFSAKVSER